MSILAECHLVGLFILLNVECLLEEERQEGLVEDGASRNLSTQAVGLWLTRRLFIWPTERTLLKMPHLDGGETPSRREFSHRPRPSSPNNNFLYNTGRENLNHFIVKKYCTEYNFFFVGRQFNASINRIYLKIVRKKLLLEDIFKRNTTLCSIIICCPQWK